MDKDEIPDCNVPGTGQHNFYFPVPKGKNGGGKPIRRPRGLNILAGLGEQNGGGRRGTEALHTKILLCNLNLSHPYLYSALAPQAGLLFFMT